MNSNNKLILYQTLKANTIVYFTHQFGDNLEFSIPPNEFVRDALGYVATTRPALPQFLSLNLRIFHEVQG